MVVYGHAGYFGWVPLVVGCATIGVVLFFFLSGFLMGHHYVPDASIGILGKSATKYWAAFVFRRFVRVYPPYVFAPILGYLLLMPYMPPDFEQTIQFDNLSILDELAKIAFFEGELGIYWTIEVELFFYLVYPFIIALCFLSRNLRWTLFSLFVVLVFFNHFPNGLGGVSWRLPLPGMWAGYTSIFIAGVLTSVSVRKIPRAPGGKRLSWNALALISFLVFVLVVGLISQSDPTQASIWNLEWLFAVLFFVMFTSLVRSDGVLSRIFSSRLAVTLGRVGYSIYLIHIIAFYIVVKYIDPKGILAAALVLIFLTSFYYMLFEKPFVRLSKRIRVGGGSASSSTGRSGVQISGGTSALP